MLLATKLIFKIQNATQICKLPLTSQQLLLLLTYVQLTLPRKIYCGLLHLLLRRPLIQRVFSVSHADVLSTAVLHRQMTLRSVSRYFFLKSGFSDLRPRRSLFFPSLVRNSSRFFFFCYFFPEKVKLLWLLSLMINFLVGLRWFNCQYLLGSILLLFYLLRLQFYMFLVCMRVWVVPSVN